mmetsp:Transcript_29421/g.21880  ORF Transcript_29421/g.21880 Transcript_29421/m.21880 type:complete len:106 (+) Transcript_29421:260-577(+)
MRSVWKYYYSSIEGIIFVFDSSNPERSVEAKDELLKMLAFEETRHIPCLIFANKQDLAGAMPADKFIELMDLQPYVSGKAPQVKVQESSAIKDQGLQQGFEWIVD